METVLVECICPICGETTYVSVFRKDWENYTNGALCQNAFPYLSPEDRELIISGICSDCWSKMMMGE